MKKYKLSCHVTQDHCRRYEAIKKYVGLGDVIYKMKDRRRDNSDLLFTTTGLMMVARKQEITTLYVLKEPKARALFNNKIPNRLFEAIMKNDALDVEIKRKLQLVC